MYNVNDVFKSIKTQFSKIQELISQITTGTIIELFQKKNKQGRGS